MSLLSVFFAEFDALQGPVVTAHYPPAFEKHTFHSENQGQDSGIWDRLMDDVSEYLIPKPELCGHLVRLVYGDNVQILGYPVVIEGSKYARNALIFNLGFMFDIAVDPNVLQDFEHVVYKVACFLRQMEFEEEFVSSNAADSLKMTRILERIFLDLNVVGECHAELDLANSLDLSLRRCASDILPFSTPVEDFDVPVIISGDLDNELSYDDLTVKTLLQYTNGVDTVINVARNANVDLAIAKKAYKELAYHEIIALVDVFKFSDVYIATSLLMELFTLSNDKRNELQACFSFPMDFSDNCLLYTCKILSLFDGSRTVKDVASLIESDVAVDFRKLVIISVVLGYLKRLNTNFDS